MKANKARFHFTCSNFDPHTFEVMNFSGTDRISCPYHFYITLLSYDPNILPEKILGAKSTFYLSRGSRLHPYSGIISRFEILDKHTSYNTYSVELVPNLWFCGLNIQTRIFQKTTVFEIIEKVLNDAGLTEYAEVKTASKNTSRYPILDYTVQYQESDLNFISRQMESNGLWYFFKENSITQEQLGSGQSIEKMIITDAPSNFSDIDSPNRITYSSPSGLVEQYNKEEFESIKRVHHFDNIIPKDIIVKNYNYRTPDCPIIANTSSNKSIKGKVFEYGGSFKNSQEATTAADLIMKRLKSRQAVINCSGDCTAFRAGSLFDLDKHFNENFNTSHLIVTVNHNGGFCESDDSQVYLNHSETVYGNSIIDYAPQKLTPVPKVTGILTARIESDGPSYATLDSNGRYKVRFPFDMSDQMDDCSGSKFIRLAQPYCGSQYGFHFPSHGGTEMILACVNGDPDKPIGIGTVPNADTLPPVIDLNRFQNIIKTAGGNSFMMDDQEGKQKIQLLTKRSAGLKIEDEQNQVLLVSSEQNQITLDNSTNVITIKNADNIITLTSKADDSFIELISKSGNNIRIDDSKKIISIKSSAGNSIHINDSEMKIILSDGEKTSSVILDSKKGLFLQSKENITIDTSQDLKICAENVKLKSAKGSIDLNASTDITITAENVIQKCNSSFNIHSKSFKTEGTGSIEMRSSDIDIKSNGKIKVSGGTTAELSSGACTSVKGGIVTIN